MISKYLFRILNLFLCFPLIATSTSIKVFKTKGSEADKNADNAKEEFWQNIKGQSIQFSKLNILGTGFPLIKAPC